MGHLQIDGFEWKIPLKWMIWGTPISGNHHTVGYVDDSGPLAADLASHDWDGTLQF